MKRNHLPLVLLALSFCLASCGFWNPDPAERLAFSLERHAKRLQKSGDVTASFDFVPDARRARTSPRFNGDIVVKVAPRPSTGADGRSVIGVSEWFGTTYHNRFVRVPKAMEAAKKPGEPFRIVLTKSRGSIYWTDLR